MRMELWVRKRSSPQRRTTYHAVNTNLRRNNMDLSIIENLRRVKISVTVYGRASPGKIMRYVHEEAELPPKIASEMLMAIAHNIETKLKEEK